MRLQQQLILFEIFLLYHQLTNCTSAAICEILLNGNPDPDKGDFFANVAHATHSLTVEDIRYFFNAIVQDDNGIPTVNTNLSSANRVLLNAPRAYPLENRDITSEYLSSTSCIRAMDQTVMLDAQDYLLKGPSLLEKVGHHFHMYELWVAAGEQLQMMISDPLLAPNNSYCACALDMPKINKALDIYWNKLKCFDNLHEKYPFHIPHEGFATEEEACSEPNEALMTLAEALVPSEGMAHRVNTLHEDAHLKSLWPVYIHNHAASMLNPLKIKDIANYMFCQLYKRA